MNEKKEALRMEILKYIEKHSRVELGELAVLVGVEETDVANEIADMEKEKIICGYHTLIDWDKAGVEIFFAPDDTISDDVKKEYPEIKTNYEEAKAAAKKLNSSMKIVPVKTVQDALDYLEKMK